MGAVDFIKTTKGKVITIGGAAVVAVGIAAAVLMQGDGYRSIAVQEVAGNVTVVGEKNNGQAYVGEHLYSGDDVTVGEASELTMCMDNDKYVYADANTHFSLQASAANEDSKIKITLDAGSELNELQSKLGANDSYEVDTPNSTMSVRGTKFRVTVYKGKDGRYYTLVEVTEGEVLVRLKTVDGDYNGEEKLLVAGQSALIRGDADISEFVTAERLDDSDIESGSSDEAVLMLAYNTLPKDGMERLIALIDDAKLEETEEAAASDKSVSETTTELESEEAASEEVSEEANETETEVTENNAVKATANAPHVHKAGGWTISIPPTCEAQGLMEQKCSCGKVMNAQIIPATGHVAGNWITMGYPGCEYDGAKEQVCAVCGKILTVESIPSSGHDWGGWSTDSEATCTSGGSSHRSCNECGATETSSTGALGHDWYNTGNWQVGPQQIIEYEWRCSRCGATDWRP